MTCFESLEFNSDEFWERKESTTWFIQITHLQSPDPQKFISLNRTPVISKDIFAITGIP